MKYYFRIDIGHVESTEKVDEIKVDSPTFTVAWHPSLYLLAYACDDKVSYFPLLCYLIVLASFRCFQLLCN